MELWITNNLYKSIYNLWLLMLFMISVIKNIINLLHFQSPAKTIQPLNNKMKENKPSLPDQLILNEVTMIFGNQYKWNQNTLIIIFIIHKFDKHVIKM